MREILSLHVGQAGIKTGDTAWELFCLEQSIKPNGFDVLNDGIMDKFIVDHDDRSTFWNQPSHGVNKFVPNSVFVDLDPTACDELRTGVRSELYNHDDIISGNGSAENNYARGYYNLGKGIIDKVRDRIRKKVEKFDSFQGFFLYHGTGGGTGSGLGSLLLENLAADFAKNPRATISIGSSEEVSATGSDPYNSVFSTHKLLKYSHVTFSLDNEAANNVCKKNLGIGNPTHATINRLMAQAISSITAGIRFGGDMFVDMTEFETNLVPNPRGKFVLSSFAPVISSSKVPVYEIDPSNMTNAAINPDNEISGYLTNCDPRQGKYMAMSLLYRGDVVLKDINSAMREQIDAQRGKSVKFVNWCPAGDVKYPSIHNPPQRFPGDEAVMKSGALCMLANTTAIVENFERMGNKFDNLYSKRAFVQKYLTEGMEESEFVEAREDIRALEKDYEEFNKDAEVEEDMEDDEY